MRSLLGVVALALLSGCASVTVDASGPSPQIVESLRAGSFHPMQAGRFSLAPGKPAEMDRALSGLRGSSIAPAKGSFALLLKDTFVAEMTAAGLYDTDSPVVVEAELTDSAVDAAIATGTGRLAARFKVLRSGQSVYDRELLVAESWDSSFMGALAIPAAINNYRALYKSLTAKLVNDPEFRKAVVR